MDRGSCLPMDLPPHPWLSLTTSALAGGQVGSGCNWAMQLECVSLPPLDRCNKPKSWGQLQPSLVLTASTEKGSPSQPMAGRTVHGSQS